jgi:hypothetical protein
MPVSNSVEIAALVRETRHRLGAGSMAVCRVYFYLEYLRFTL